jgi:hypothetical protein
METLFETFDSDPFDKRLNWFCPPEKWGIRDSQLIIEPNAGSDFWQRTHYGFRSDNGHLLYLPLHGDFVMSTHVHFHPAHQYDQAGLMVRFSPDCWMKASVEVELDGPYRLGAVVTNNGYSDWSTQSFPKELEELDLRITRRNQDYMVEFLDRTNRSGGGMNQWVQLRLAHLSSSDEADPQCGLYACSPKEAGYVAKFDTLKVEV